MKDQISKISTINQFVTVLSQIMQSSAHEIRNVLRYLNTIFLTSDQRLRKEYPGLSINASVSDMNIDSFILYDFANYIDRKYHEKVDLDARAPYYSYSGCLDFESQGHFGSIPFTLHATTIINSYLVGKCHENLQLWIELPTIGRSFLFGKEGGPITDHIISLIVHTIQQNYDFTHLTKNNIYRRKTKKITTLENLSSRKNRQFQLIQDIDERKELAQWWLYDGSGGEFYHKKMVNSYNTYSDAYNKKNKNLKEFLHENKQMFIGVENFIDIGSLNGTKVLEILLGFDLEGVSYIGIDATVKNLLDLANLKSNVCNGGHLIGVDFVPSGLPFEKIDTLKDYPNKILFDLGNTLGNEFIVNMKKKLEQYNTCMSSDDMLILELSMFTDHQSMIDFVQSDGVSIAKEWIGNAIQRLVISDITTEDMQCIWDKNDRYFKVLVNHFRDTTYKLSNHTTTMKQGTQLLALKSKRFTESDVIDLIDCFGLQIVQSRIIGDQGIFVIKKNPK